MATDLTARIAVKPETSQKVGILASRAVCFMGFDEIGKLIEYMGNDAWEEAKVAGLVTEAMLERGERALEKA